MNIKRQFVQWAAVALGALALSPNAFAWSELIEMQLDPSRAFTLGLPPDWERLSLRGVGRWPRYGAQSRTPEEIRLEVVIAGINAAHQLTNQGKFADALAKLRELDGLSGKTPDETYIVERTRLAVASRTNDKAMALQAAQAAFATGRAPGADLLLIEDFLARSYYNQKAYGQAAPWIARYLKDGGSDSRLRDALPRAYYLSGDYAQALAAARGTVENHEKAGKAPSEDLFNVWANAALNLNDQGQYTAVLEKIAGYYPKKEYWNELLTGVLSAPGFSDALTLDVYRFMLASGQIVSVDEYMDMAQAALLTGHPGQARRLLAQGFDAGVLGQGAQAAKHRQLREKADKAAVAQAQKLSQEASAAVQSRSGDAFCNVGQLYADHGQIEKGIALMEQGIRRGNLYSPDRVKLRLGALYAVTRRNQDALQMLRQVQGKDGSADLARYWRIFIEARERVAATDKPVS